MGKGAQDKLRAVPMSLAEANKAVAKWHRHHKPVRFHLFSFGVMSQAGLCGAVIVMRPVSQHRSFHGFMAEISRLVTDGTPNACSFLLGNAARCAFGMGFMGIQTYTLATESGASLKAAGWTFDTVVRGRPWTTTTRKRNDDHPLIDKHRWVRINEKAIAA
jgi:hypothetical protein